MKQALRYARSRQSSLTTMVHGSHLHPDSWETIPIFENLCFVIALFRSRTVANTLEGRELLEKILAFQISSGDNSGLFPRYIHEYPHREQRGYLISIMVALALLKSRHMQILHTELQQRLSNSIEKLMEALEKQSWMDSISILLQIMQGKLPSCDTCLALRPTSVRECSYLLYIVQFLFLRESPDAGAVFYHLTSYWSTEMRSYVGPLEKEYYVCGEEVVSLFHYFMVQITNSPVQIPLGIVHLHSSLLYPLEYAPEIQEKLPLLHKHWNIQQSGGLLWQMCNHLPELTSKGFHLFRILWREEIVHSMVCQQRIQMTCCKIEESESEITLEDLPEHGLELYFRKTKYTKVYSNGKRATCFHAGEWIVIHTGNTKIALQFTTSDNACAVASLSIHHRPAELQPDSSTIDWRLSIRILSTDNKRSQLHLRVRGAKGCPSQDPLYATHCLHKESLQ